MRLGGGGLVRVFLLAGAIEEGFFPQKRGKGRRSSLRGLRSE